MKIDVGVHERTLILSDLHIGDPRFCNCLLHWIWKLVQKEAPTLLVLAGDVLESNLATGEQLAKLRSICNLVENVVVLQGNHDTRATQRFAQSISAKFGTTLLGASAAASFAVEHGQRFDSLWKKVPGIGRLSIWANRILYRITGFDFQAWLRTFKRTEKKLLKQHAKAKAAWADKDIVVTGHTHLPTNDPFGVGYFNSGDWIYHRTYVTITNGAAQLKSVQE